MGAITKPPHPSKTGWLKNPRSERDGEKIGGGFFVFRRGDDTGRIRPSQPWPFEHPTREAAEIQAGRLAAKYPGYRFDVLAVVSRVSTVACDPEAG